MTPEDGWLWKSWTCLTAHTRLSAFCLRVLYRNSVFVSLQFYNVKLWLLQTLAFAVNYSTKLFWKQTLLTRTGCARRVNGLHHTHLNHDARLFSLLFPTECTNMSAHVATHSKCKSDVEIFQPANTGVFMGDRSFLFACKETLRST